MPQVLAKEGLTPHILVVFPMFKVGEVVLVLVGFLFEANVAIGLHAVSVLDEQEKPLEEIPDKEGQIEQFLLLGGMDKFMVELLTVQRRDGKDKPEQANGKKGLAHRVSLDEINLMLLALLHLQNY